MKGTGPNIIVLSGPNGSGKSTAGPALIRETLGVSEFVDADRIARGLSPKDPGRVAIEAGKIMLRRLRELAGQRESFAFETTLASRSFAPWIAGLANQGWRFTLLFLWLPSVELAIQRVSGRARLGGHDVPEVVIRRRFRAGLGNFFQLYRPIAAEWRFYDNSGMVPHLIATGIGKRQTVANREVWDRITGEYEHA